MSLPSRERGLKYYLESIEGNKREVAPFAGAWIEISVLMEFYDSVKVAPFAGAWIEISKLFKIYSPLYVAPFAGAWIEIPLSVVNDFLGGRSLRGSVD